MTPAAPEQPSRSRQRREAAHGEAPSTGAATPGQAAGDPSPLFARWYRLKTEVSDASIERLWRMAAPADREFWRSLDAAQERPAPADAVPDLLLDRMDKLDRIADMCRCPAEVAGRSSGSGIVNGTNLAAAILRVIAEDDQ